MPHFVYGHWPVKEAMRAGRRQFEKLVISDRLDEKGPIADIIDLATHRGITINRVQKRVLDDIAEGGNHQGVVLRLSPYPYIDIEHILAHAAALNEKPFILLLDLLKDPQNVGTLLRVAEVVGVHGVVLQERRSVGVTASVAAASSGAVEHMNIAQVTNIVNTMKQLKENDVWMVGVDIGPNIPALDKIDLDISVGMVLGSEGEGMRRLVRDTCDLLVTLPMRGKVGSLNVATAGSVALYSAWRARGWDGWAHA
jgi:23S rRNA (guanosine2251-2'-O)-methyltransferase